MTHSLRLLAYATFAVLGISSAFAETNGELPPDCPGGGTATGKITCTGPVLKPICTEGPPWTCTLKDDKQATLEVDTGGTVRPPRHTVHIMPPMSLSDGNGDGGGSPGGPSDGGGGGGGVGPGGIRGDLGAMPTMTMDPGPSGPSLL